MARLDKIETEELHLFLKHLPPHKRASIIKLIHQWNPYNLFLHRQQRMDSPNCSRCGISIIFFGVLIPMLHRLDMTCYRQLYKHYMKEKFTQKLLLPYN
jgi:hypothetical protein